MGDFSDRVFEVVRRIPRGKVATYGQVGRLIGAPRSARYVGYALRANPEPGAEVNSIPCHRVVFKDGGLCKGFAFGGPEVQREMLEAEGVAFADDAHVDMGACLWDGRMDDADDPTLPMAPPEDFDWERSWEHDDGAGIRAGVHRRRQGQDHGCRRIGDAGRCC